MEKAIEIKRRAQRCVQNGDLDGALAEYEKLVQVDDSDPYSYVLLADLYFKKGDLPAASQRYLTAATAYEKSGLYKNAIAVCKKMMRLSLTPSSVLERLAALHALDGLTTESALYWMQYAEGLVREDRLEDAASSLRKAFETCPENVKGLERLAEVNVLLNDKATAAQTWLEAAEHYQRGGLLQDADRCRSRADQLRPGSSQEIPPPIVPGAEPPVAAPARFNFADHSSVSLPGVSAPEAPPQDAPENEAAAVTASAEPAPVMALEQDVPGTVPAESEEHEALPPRLETPVATDEDEEEEPAPHVTAIPTLASRDAVAPAEVEEHTNGVPAADDSDEVEVLHETEAEDEAEVISPHALSDAPGLSFPPAAPEPEPAPRIAVGRRVEELLGLAQQQFRAGERDAASRTLVQAAEAYDELGQHDSAATIYRSLGKSTHAGREVMMLWLQNCERRSDRNEAAQVACELGDRALNDGDANAAREWFERAMQFDPSNAVAQRRLQRITGGGGVAVETAPAPSLASAGSPEAPPAEMGRVEVAVGRGEAVTFDLGSLVAEFQRGVEVQLGGDPQGHYDLGMAYREMGLLEQAVSAFRNAQQNPGFAHRCSEMIGRCLLDQGRFDEAAEEFQSALRKPGLAGEMAADLHFQLGLAHEAAGRTREAIGSFEKVYEAQSNYPDVAMKIRVLRTSLETR